jgi:hypothetical protein
VCAGWEIHCRYASTPTPLLVGFLRRPDRAAVALPSRWTEEGGGIDVDGEGRDDGGEGCGNRLGEAGTRVSNVARESESDAQLYSYRRGGSAKVCNAVARRRRGGAALAEREQAQPPVA